MDDRKNRDGAVSQKEFSWLGGAAAAPPERPPRGRHRFDFAPWAARLLRLAGIRPRTCWVRVDEHHLDVRFGPWRVRTPLANVAGATPDGPYRAWRAVGVRLSLPDGGLTFGSSTRGGVRVRFHRPVRGLDPWGLARHPTLTVTVTDPHRLASALRAHALP